MVVRRGCLWTRCDRDVRTWMCGPGWTPAVPSIPVVCFVLLPVFRRCCGPPSIGHSLDACSQRVRGLLVLWELTPGVCRVFCALCALSCPSVCTPMAVAAGAGVSTLMSCHVAPCPLWNLSGACCICGALVPLSLASAVVRVDRQRAWVCCSVGPRESESPQWISGPPLWSRVVVSCPGVL